MSVNKVYTVEVVPDFFQFLLLDEASDDLSGDTYDLWRGHTERTNGIGAVKGCIVVDTQRSWEPITIQIEVVEREPDEDDSRWERITKCGIDISSGTLVVMGIETSKASVPPDKYSARIFSNGIAFSQPDEVSQPENHRVVLWPGSTETVTALKGYGMAVS